MPAAKPKFIKERDGFPYFIKLSSTEFLIKANKLPVSDIWGLWHYIIHTEKSKFGKKVNLAFLESLLEQAQYFFEAATKAPVKSQPLLYYYSFLNLTKAYLNIEVEDIGDSVDFYHGIEQSPITAATKLNTAYIEVKSLVNAPPALGNKISVAYNLSQNLRDNYKKIAAPPPGYDNGPWKFNVESLLLSCIGIHRTVSETYHSMENFVHLKDPELWKEGKKLIWKARIETNKNVMNGLTNAGYDIISEDGSKYWYESMALATNNLPKRDLFSMWQMLENKGVWCYCARDGYRFYISHYGFKKHPLDDTYRYDVRIAGQESIMLSSLTVIYFLMFFFGSITRYHPYLFERILSNKEIWMVSEFLRTQPRQYLHLLTSKVLATPVLFTRMPN